MRAFDADVLIHASTGDPRGDLLANAVAEAAPGGVAGLGSVLLLTETLVPGVAEPHHPRLRGLLARLRLVPVTREVAAVAATLRGVHGLKTPDALHLATAIVAGADQFVTGNRRDFDPRMPEIEIVLVGQPRS
ncbi:type II toxin-antitoxin system VapC family toxin [Aeromicrobium alkaliterrae]|uniref:PIN domain-containing protein n=1 Tax=Aeromicrobium alkaliterrae TaxID=302168 RepID=A0ABP4VXS0_9ACTN